MSELRTYRPAPVGVPQVRVGVGSMKGSQHLLPRAFAKLERRGELQEIGERRLNARTGELTIFYRRLKPPVPAYVKHLKRAAVAVAGVAVAYLLLRVVVGVVLAVFPFLIGAALVVGGVMLVLSMSRGHACVGLHCGGCKG
jgi:hypothetical protein